MGNTCCGDGSGKKQMKKTTPTEQGSANVSRFRVSGMDCADEVSAVENSLNLTSIKRVDANIMNETVTVYHDGSPSDADIRKLIEKAGLKIVVEEKASFLQGNRKRIWLVSFAGIALGVGVALDQLTEGNQFAILLYGLTILTSGWIIFPKALRSIRKFHLDMNVLMTVAVVGAVLIKEYSEAATVVFLFSLAELLEALSVERARRAIKDVLKVAPKTALLIQPDGGTQSVDVDVLKITDVILVRPGDSIPIDGSIEEGITTVNESSLTGESLPVEKVVGASVFAGTINESGAIKVKVEKLFNDTKIAKIISLVEDAQNEKAPSQRFVDQFALIYTPAVMILAIAVALIPPLFFDGNWDQWIYKSLMLLVIGCPCALVIATPVSVVSGLTSLAKRGILVKGGVHLESLGKLKAVALDKTGTITEGTPEVTSLRLFAGTSESDSIQIAASLESLSSHPLALALLKYAAAKQISFDHPKNFRIIPGKGAEGVVKDHVYFVGNHKLAHELGVCGPEIEAHLDELEAKSMSVIVLGHKPHADCKGEILAIFGMGDKIRTNAKSAVSEFHKAGILNVTMLSGDNQKTVDAVAKQVGIDVAKGGLLPDDKVREVKSLVAKYKFVGMVGDGVNDAPALATATLGIAMGVVGSDTAIETADVALMKDDLSMLPKAISHGRQVLNVIRFNIAFAIFIKVIFFVLAFAGLANLWLAVAADMGASLLVTFNALRLLRVKE